MPPLRGDKREKYTISLDTETTGLDCYHGCRPFFVTSCDSRTLLCSSWQWEVDPVTRQPATIQQDLREIEKLLLAADEIVLQNSKFDITALYHAGLSIEWPWEKTRCTLLAGHLLASNHPHNLTAMVLTYLGKDISPYETALEKIVKEARKYAEELFPSWRLGKAGLPELPSSDSQFWRNDYWLPAALGRVLNLQEDHPWMTALEEYSNVDSTSTLLLWNKMKQEIESRDLWSLYLTRLKALPIIYGMEKNGLTVSRLGLETIQAEYTKEVEEKGQLCLDIAAEHGYPLKLPKGASPNNSLREFIYDVLCLPPIYSKKSKTGDPSLDKASLEHYQETLAVGGKEHLFISTLIEKRSRDTALTYMRGYKEFCLPIEGVPDWYLLHPKLNPTGTSTTRLSCSDPNEQNISKKKGFNLRRCFGPLPGEEWYSADAQNIELRLPAYESGEQEMIDLFEHPNDPPYYGSKHLLVFDTLYPKEFAEHGAKCKSLYESTLYQWVKNGNFAVQYGAIESSGTADRAYHMPGAQNRIQGRFAKQAALNKWCIDFAEKHGYIETLPDRTVDPTKGYPLLCTRTDYGRILPTVPLNYRVQGSAGWWMMKAMIRCEEQLLRWRAEGFKAYIVLTVHDELVFAMPKSTGCPVQEHKRVLAAKAKPTFRTSNLWRVRILQRLMEQGGEDFGIPTPVSVEYHPSNWSEGVAL